MGQIVIDMPGKKTRHYVLKDAKCAEELLTALELSAVRVKNTPLACEELEYVEDAIDIAASDKALREFARTGESYNWEDVKAELGL